jgi:serine/threonine protein phosphatase PrpC
VIGTSDGKTISLTEDHKPSLPEEKARIAAAGGFVFMDRVNGELAMSRALGDYQYKRNAGLAKDKQMVICYPDVAVHPRGDTDGIMILACDGVWDVMSNSDAVSFLLDMVMPSEKTSTSQDLAGALVDISLTQGSTDNITAIVVKLNGDVSPSAVAMNDSIEDDDDSGDDDQEDEDSDSDDEGDDDDVDSSNIDDADKKKKKAASEGQSKLKPAPGAQKTSDSAGKKRKI